MGLNNEYMWDKSNLNLLMSYNNHFYYHLWRDIKEVLDEGKDDSKNQKKNYPGLYKS